MTEFLTLEAKYRSQIEGLNEDKISLKKEIEALMIRLRESDKSASSVKEMLENLQNEHREIATKYNVIVHYLENLDKQGIDLKTSIGYLKNFMSSHAVFSSIPELISMMDAYEKTLASIEPEKKDN